MALLFCAKLFAHVQDHRNEITEIEKVGEYKNRTSGTSRFFCDVTGSEPAIKRAKMNRPAAGSAAKGHELSEITDNSLLRDILCLIFAGPVVIFYSNQRAQYAERGRPC